ncbi:MAG: hypothetical protein ABH817_00870 [archaeon]
MAKKDAPVMIKVIAILFYIGAAISLIGGVLSFLGGSLISSLIPVVGLLGSGLFIAIGVILIGFAVLDFFIGKGIWNGQNWARIVAIVLAILGFVGAISSLIEGSLSGIINLIINGGIGYYLLFVAEVKKHFK